MDANCFTKAMGKLFKKQYLFPVEKCFEKMELEHKCKWVLFILLEYPCNLT